MAREKVSQYEDIKDIIRLQIGSPEFHLCYSDVKYLISLLELAEPLAEQYSRKWDEGVLAKQYLKKLKS